MGVVGTGISNSGTITATASQVDMPNFGNQTAVGSGIYLNGTGSSGTGINNTGSGQISGTATQSIINNGFGGPFTGVGVGIQIDEGEGGKGGAPIVSGGITNAVGASITGNATFTINPDVDPQTLNRYTGIGVGILVDSQGQLLGGITNSGIITGTGTVTAQPAALSSINGVGAGIFLADTAIVSGGITNNSTGSITGNVTGILVDTGATLDGITNNGTITGTSKSLDLNNTANAFAVTNTGTLNGAVNLGINTLNLNGTSGRVIGDVTGTGNVNVNGTFTTEGNLSNTGSVNIASGGVLNLANTITTAPVVDNGTLDISRTSGTTITAISGSGSVALGSKNLSISNASGNLSGAITGTGGLAVTGGIQTLSGVSSYTGTTTINSGANLSLSGSGSIAGSSQLIDNGTFDISQTTTGATVKTLSGDGSVILGTKNLTVTNGNGLLAVSLIGDGGLNLAGGNLTLIKSNNFAGGVKVLPGAVLAIPNASVLGVGPLVLAASATTPATLKVLNTTAISNPIIISGDPIFDIAPGTTTTVNSTIDDGTIPGDVVLTGGGTLALTAANTYTGVTTVQAGSTLALTGAGSIAASSSVTNNGNFNITGKTANVSVAAYTQTSTGNLAMNFSPSSNQKLIVAGAASLAGGLNLNASAGTYSIGSKYTLLTANGITGSFGSLSSNLSSYTNLGYGLTYDANDVYLIFTPSSASTQQSLVNTSQALQNTFTLQNSVLANSFSYDCTEFGVNNICLSVGGRNTAVSAANGLNNTSGLLIAAYRPHSNYRIGAYADQNFSVNNAGSTVNLGNNTPLIGLFGAWNERLDGTGTEVKVSAAYGQKNTTVTRSVVGTSEAGSGSSQLNSQGAQVTAKYGFGIVDNVIVSPYLGMRYTQNNMGGYTEGTSSSVTAPLTYGALNTNATTALAGVGASYRFIPAATLFASAGIETDTNTANGTYSATGISGLTPINFNVNPVKTRPTAMFGAYYDVAKNQRLGITGIYRQEPFQAVSTTSVMATYAVGL